MSVPYPQGQHWRLHTLRGSVFLPQLSGSASGRILPEEGLVLGRGTLDFTSPFLLTRFLRLASFLHGPPWLGKSSSNIWPGPKGFNAAFHLSPYKSRLLELDEDWICPTPGHLCCLFQLPLCPEHCTSKAFPFLVTWLDRLRISSQAALPMFFSNSNYEATGLWMLNKWKDQGLWRQDVVSFILSGLQRQ